MSADDLTQQIADVLAAHRGRSDEDGPPEQLCECGVTSEYLISDEFYNAITWPTEDAIEAAAFERFDREIEAHQAEQVRAVLGETTTEYGLRFGDGSIDDGAMTAELPELRREIRREWIAKGYHTSTDYEPMTIVSRTYLPEREVTPWTEVQP